MATEKIRSGFEKKGVGSAVEKIRSGFEKGGNGFSMAMGSSEVVSAWHLQSKERCGLVNPTQKSKIVPGLLSTNQK